MFCIIKSESLHLIQSTLHSFNSHIKFTYEAEQNFVLPFLDILIIRTPNKFHCTVYYKKTIPPQYTHFSSNSPIAYKINTVRTLSKIIFTHCSLTIFKTIEKARIVSILIEAGYPRPFIYRHFYDPSVSKSTTIHRASCFLPYSTSSLAISRILRPFGIKVYYNSSPCLATILRHPITKADNPNLPIHSTGAVYVVSCQDCSSTYVGETGRTTYIRLTEHKRNIYLYICLILSLGETQMLFLRRPAALMPLLMSVMKGRELLMGQWLRVWAKSPPGRRTKGMIGGTPKMQNLVSGYRNLTLQRLMELIKAALWMRNHRFNFRGNTLRWLMELVTAATRLQDPCPVVLEAARCEVSRIDQGLTTAARIVAGGFRGRTLQSFKN
ncbi:hypothetical protein LAZ67_4002353 [Cordylochernes scorpioides]|uniref:Helix-turn-helix domain-containing protein n=1 Tax=Cordylochernes scorpioides TaxID=51811 RepID=A0ABY6KG39_9ARAC|nr:hypothetical protein LAZ67_4002353 [Cordylochernes scorpioides]